MDGDFGRNFEIGMCRANSMVVFLHGFRARDDYSGIDLQPAL